MSKRDGEGMQISHGTLHDIKATTTTTIYFGIPIYIHGITYTSSTNQVLHVSKNNITDY